MSIYLSPNLLIWKMGIDRPFTIILFGTIGINRPSTILRIVLDNRHRYVDLSPFYCFSVGEQMRSKAAGLGTINSSSPFIIHAARPSSPVENPRKRRCLFVSYLKKLKVDGLNNKVITTYVCSMRSSSLQCFTATCL